LALIGQRPLLGHGYASYARELPEYLSEEMRHALADDNTFVRHAHNEFLEKTAEEGLVGLAIFLWLLGCVFYLGKQGMRNERWRPLIRVLIPGVAALLITNSFGIDLRLPAGRAGFFIILALIPGAARGLLRPRSYEWLLNSWQRRSAYLAGCLFLSGLISFQVVSPVLVGKSLKDHDSFFEAGKTDPAEELERLLSIQEQAGASPGLWQGIADQYAKLGEWQRAEESYRQCLSGYPANRIAALRLGNTVFNQGRLAEAEEIFHKLVSDDRNNAEAHFNLGYVYFCRKKTKQALRQFEIALAIDPKHAGAAALKARIVH